MILTSFLDTIGEFFASWNPALLVSVGILLVFGFVGRTKGVARVIVMILSIALATVTVALLINMVDDMLHDKASDGVKALVFLVLIAFLFWIFYFLGKALRILHNIPIVHGLDSFLGLLVGFLFGIFVILILFIVLERYDLWGTNEYWIAQIGENPVLNWVYTHNFMKNLLFPG